MRKRRRHYILDESIILACLFQGFLVNSFTLNWLIYCLVKVKKHKQLSQNAYLKTHGYDN